MPRLIQVIESYETRGEGKEGDPVRQLRQYHDVNGKFLAEEHDPWCKGGKEAIKK